MRMLRVTAAPLDTLGEIQEQLREQRDQRDLEALAREPGLERMVVEELVRLLGKAD
jgi:hypothetical protein